MRNNKQKGFLPIVLIFITFNAFFIVGKNFLQRWNADSDVLIIGNLILFTVTLISYFMAKRGLRNPNPHAFTRSVYSSILIKLFVCMIAALTYIAIYKQDLNKAALFTCMGLYLLYTFLEVAILTKLLKRKEP